MLADLPRGEVADPPPATLEWSLSGLKGPVPPFGCWSKSAIQSGKLGDNGKPNDNMLMHILSPYPQHRSALTDCLKLSRAGFGGPSAVVIVGYGYADMPLEPAIGAFEALARTMVDLGTRSEAAFSGLRHPMHREGAVIGWMVR
jgi:hypothetical protein